ncbi:MAG: hypothetical protein IPJ20_13475 [Flammeovirgaceae bacterium]|nr:hypothetical protein [Flammeovirgaceae bacterium]
MLAIFGFISYLAPTTRAPQNKPRWVGLAKETAHQLAPTLLLMAWGEVLRDDPDIKIKVLLMSLIKT